MTDDSTYLPVDLQRGLKTLPPEREDPFPHPADLSPDALLSRRVEVIGTINTLEQAGTQKFWMRVKVFRVKHNRRGERNRL